MLLLCVVFRYRYCFPFGRPEGGLKATLSLLERVSRAPCRLAPLHCLCSVRPMPCTVIALCETTFFLSFSFLFCWLFYSLLSLYLLCSAVLTTVLFLYACTTRGRLFKPCLSFVNDFALNISLVVIFYLLSMSLI